MAALDDVVDALRITWTALPAMEGVTIYDGPPATEDDPRLVLLIGDDGNPESDAETTYEQSWVDMACTRREETGEILCAVIVQTGDTSFDAPRSRAKSIVAALQAALVADMTLGGVVYSATFDRGSARPLQNESGAAVVQPFTIRYRTQV